MGFGKDWNEDGKVTPLEDVGTVFAMGRVAELLKPKTKKEAEQRQEFALVGIGIGVVVWVCLACLCAIALVGMLFFNVFLNVYLFITKSVPVQWHYVIDFGFPITIVLVGWLLFRKPNQKVKATKTQKTEELLEVEPIDTFWLKRGDAMRGPVSRQVVTAALEQNKLAADDLIAVGEEGPWEPLSRRVEDYGFKHTF